MKHLDKDFWLAYSLDRVTDMERKLAEKHLYACDHCLKLYAEAAESSHGIWPEQAEALTEKVMSGLQSTRQNSSGHERKTKVLHYMIAASITFLLMSSGVFHELFSYTDKWRISVIAEHDTPLLTEKVMDRTSEVLNSWVTGKTGK